MPEMTKAEIRAEVRTQVKAMDEMVASLLDWVEADASDDKQLIEKLIHLSGATDSFLTMTR